jgi:tetratricopeptide (TPR) repeat protein
MPRPDKATQSFRLRWWFALAGVLLFGLISQVLVLVDGWHPNPFASVPMEDADTYWSWAGEIAQGRLLGSTPFMSAPLYPYLLGVIRALGGGLPTVYGLQLALHLATAGLLAWGTARRFSPAAGLLASVLFVLLTEPAFFTGRVLNCSLQLFLVVLLWLAAMSAQRRGSLGAWSVAGVVLGLNCLANSPMSLAIALFALWAWWQSGWRLQGLARTAILCLTAFVVIAPATLHNYLVSHEFILTSAQGGVTFAQGNAPEADGTYTPIAGVSAARQEQSLDALRLYRQTTGESGGWNAAQSFFFHRGFDYWRAHPGAAVRLLARKMYWFLTGTAAGEIYYPTLEIESGLAPWLRATPLPLSWLMWPALLTLGWLACSPRRYAPELILFLLPLLVVVIFFYSPRYRLPALPIVVVACALGLCQATAWRNRPKWSAAMALAVAAGLALGIVNRATGFERLAFRRANFLESWAWALTRTGQLAQAVPLYRQSLALDPSSASAAANLGDVLGKLGQPDQALVFLQQAVRAAPENGIARDQLGRLLAAQGRSAEALAEFRRAVQCRPDQAQLRYNLGTALARGGDLSGALEQFRAAVELDPTYALARLSLGRLLKERGDLAGAREQLRTAVRLNPTLATAHYQLATVLAAEGDTAEAIASLQRALTLDPNNADAAQALARYRSAATLPAVRPN